MDNNKQIKVRCPRCGNQVPWQDNPHRPFCSDQCRLVDLGRWASEEYRIPERNVDPEELDNLVQFPEKD